MPKAQILLLDPSSELSFKGPFSDYVTSNLRLTNPTDRSIFFKVKTTAPRYYCVRPNSGLINPSETATVNVTLQPVEYPENAEKERARHKFMIQAAFAPQEDVGVDAFWKNVKPTDVADSKLRVVFIPPDGGDVNGDEASPATQKDVSATNNSSSPHPPYAPAYLPSDAPQRSSYGTGKSTGADSPAGNNQMRDHELQKERELRKMYQDEKSKLESEYNKLLEKMENVARSAGNLNADGLPLLHVILVAIFAFLIGIILGKLIF